MAEKIIFTSESVTEGHPDKLCDQISDAILDECLKQDKNSRVACETAAKNSTIWVFGEITTLAKIDFYNVIKKTLDDVGYNNDRFGINSNTFTSMISIVEQSPNIAQGVNEGEGLFLEQGAGDQGIMFGYACDETQELMPLPITLAHKLAQRLSEVRKNKTLDYIGPDGKTQVSVVYENNEPKYVDTVIISTQHFEEAEHSQIKDDITKQVIEPVCGQYLTKDTKIYVNPTGKFVVGGPVGDAGLTGRKIIVDTYGGMGRHGGGAFSGKDPSKVDRSAAYMARYIAKNIVASGIAKQCEIQLSYAIGMAQPVSVLVNTFGTGKKTDEEISTLIRKNFDLRPKAIINHLDLLKPIYKKAASYGHFGRDSFPWERTDVAESLRKEACI